MPVRTSPRNETGLIKPTRPKPSDFRERYLEMGWDREIEDHYRCNWRCIRTWIIEEGRDQLRADRAAAVFAKRAAVSSGSAKRRLVAADKPPPFSESALPAYAGNGPR